MKKVILLILIFLCAGGLSLSQTSFTATYNLSGGGNDVVSFPYNGTNYSGIIMGNLLKVGISSASSIGNFRGDHWPTGATDGSDIFTGSVDLGKYISFSISSVSGYSFTVTSITFGIGRSPTGPRQWEWRGNQDNYSSILTNYTFVNVNLTNSFGVLTNPDGNGYWMGNILNVSSSYTDVIGTAEFRFFGFNAEGTAGTGGLQGNITINGTFDFALPVELTSFSGFVNNENIILNWQTATEVNNYGFEIERNTPLNPLSRGEVEGMWEKIGFVNGNGNSNSPKSYSFIDNDFSDECYLYRLKQIDNDGQFEYSKTVEVSFIKPDALALEQNYPNPFNPTTKIKYTIPSATLRWQSHRQAQGDILVSLKVFDVLGNEVASLVNETQQPGTYEVEFNADKLSSGVYYYQLQAGDFVENKKMVLLQ